MISSLLSASGPALFVAVLACGVDLLDLPATYPPEVTR